MYSVFFNKIDQTEGCSSILGILDHFRQFRHLPCLRSLLAYYYKSNTAPVTMIFINASGISTFHPSAIS